MKNKKAKAELGLKTDPLAKMAPDHIGGEYDIKMALADAREKLSPLQREVHPRTVYHLAQTILKEKKSSKGPRVFQGENEYQDYLKSQGVREADDDDYQSRTHPPRFSSLD